jgi:hypothetical protein
MILLNKKAQKVSPECTIKGSKNEAVKKSLLFRAQILEQKSLYTENIQ